MQHAFLLSSAATFALALTAQPAFADDHSEATDPAAEARTFSADDIFDLTVGTDPQISPDGKTIVYVRRANDIMTDSVKSAIWKIDVSSGTETPLIAGEGAHFSPRWSPDGSKLAYISTANGAGPELHVHWMRTGADANITSLPESPSGITWSPDGETIAFTARIPGKGLTLGSPPAKPEGAKWGQPLQVIDKVTYRRDGGTYVKPGTVQLFVVSAKGGAPRQLTFDDYDNGGAVEFSPDGSKIYYSANRSEDWDLEPLRGDIYALDVESGDITALTDRVGPDFGPQVSPNGRQIAYLGRDDVGNAFDQTNLYVMNADGSGARQLAGDLDRGIDGLEWTDAGLYASFEEDGQHRVARISLSGGVSRLAPLVGSPYYALPYTGGQWSVSDNGVVAFTTASTQTPPDIGVTSRSGTRTLTSLNAVSMGGKDLGQTRELAVTAPDGQTIPAWIQLPAGYKEGDKVPMILEIHGGPYAAYGPEFSADYHLYNSAGYSVVFSNPGGSTGYGEVFADRIEDNYPISNFDELMAVVDAAIAAGYVDPDNLYVTGGSGGGLLTAWLVGKTDRFKAAASHKPVINWTSHTLMADGLPLFARYWLGGMPWDRPEHFWNRSPLSLVGNVTTPTLVLVGAEDYRTPLAESEQYYGALKLKGVDTALVVTPDSSHNNLSQSPSQQAARTASVIAWFDKYRKGKDAASE